MPNSELDQLDIDKKKLEIEKLKSEIKIEKYFPAKKLTFWQAVAPPLLTVISVILTGLILLNLNVFDVNNKLLEIKTDNLKAIKTATEAEIATDTVHQAALKKTNDSLTGANYDLVKNNLKSELELKKAKDALNRTKSDLEKSQNQLAQSQEKNNDLNTENRGLVDANDTLKANNRRLQTQNVQLDGMYKDKRDDGVFQRNITKKWADEADSLKKELKKCKDGGG